MKFSQKIVSILTAAFFIAGAGLVVQFFVVGEKKDKAGIASIDEGSLVEGNWVAGRRLNGDQSHQGRHVQLPGQAYSMVKVKLYRYQ